MSPGDHFLGLTACILMTAFSSRSSVAFDEELVLKELIRYSSLRIRLIYIKFTEV